MLIYLFLVFAGSFNFSSPTSVRLPKDKLTGKTRGFAYLVFDDNSGAENAIEALSGVEFEGRPLKASVVLPREDRAERSERPASRSFQQQENSVFIGNLNFDTTVDEISALVANVFGPDLNVNVRLAVDRETGNFLSGCLM